jgi:hypothetical protein
MKWIAFILFLVFTLVQVLPAIYSFSSDTKGCFFNTYEEKGAEKNDKGDKKENKDYTTLPSLAMAVTVHCFALLPLAEKILTPPCLDKLTPPPNFC